MLKPILVATEKIKDYIYVIFALRRKFLNAHCRKNQSKFTQRRLLYPRFKMRKSWKTSKTSTLTSIWVIQPQFSVYLCTKFKETTDYEKSDQDEDLKNKLSSLSLADNRSEASILRTLKRRNPYAKGTVIEIKKVNKKTEKMLNQNMIEFALHYINNIVKTTTKDWQITRNFVTNMVEVNYNRLLQLESQISTKANELKNEIKIRFIQPAQDFYNRLMEIWIIFKTNSLNKEVFYAGNINQ